METPGLSTKPPGVPDVIKVTWDTSGPSVLDVKVRIRDVWRETSGKTG